MPNYEEITQVAIYSARGRASYLADVITCHIDVLCLQVSVYEILAGG
jgi:hypothetical protein